MPLSEIEKAVFMMEGMEVPDLFIVIRIVRYAGNIQRPIRNSAYRPEGIKKAVAGHATAVGTS